MSTQTQDQVDLDLLGSQARHHYAAADRHDKKKEDHEKAAALLLLEARNAIFPNYDPFARTSKAKACMDQWHDYLAKHDISEKRARLGIRAHTDPEGLAAYEERERQRVAARDKERAEAVRAARERSRASPAHDPVDNSESTTPSASIQRQKHGTQVVSIERMRLSRLAKSLTNEQLKQLIAIALQMKGSN